MADIKQMLRRGFEEGMNGRKFEVFDSMLHPEYENHSFPAPEKGPAGMKAVLNMFLAAFPDMVITLDDVLADGNNGATRGHWEGTHKGDFMGIPATGKKVSVNYMDLWKLSDGRLKDNWVVMDIAGLMQQLGVKG